MSGEVRVKRCQRPEDHRAHEPYVESPDGPDLACPGGPAHDLELIELASRTIASARRDLDQAVARARANGRSYADIGAVLGVSRQAAWERFHRLEQDVAS
jgi:DNA-directed RNA polymerase specialized sigma24 family protein